MDEHIRSVYGCKYAWMDEWTSILDLCMGASMLGCDGEHTIGHMAGWPSVLVGGYMRGWHPCMHGYSGYLWVKSLVIAYMSSPHTWPITWGVPVDMWVHPVDMWMVMQMEGWIQGYMEGRQRIVRQRNLEISSWK